MDVHSAISGLTTDIPEAHYQNSLKKLVSANVDFLDPQSVNLCIKSNFENCKRRPKSKRHGIRWIFKFILKLLLIVPYGFWKLYVQPKIKEIEFTSTFRFAIAITIAPAFVLIMAIIIGSYFGIKMAFLYLIAILGFTLLTVKL